VSAPSLSQFAGRVLARTRNDRLQLKPIRRTVPRLVVFDSGCTPLEKPDSAGAVTAGGMGQTHTDLRETLPQVALFVRTRFPTGLQTFMRSERPILPHQPPGQGNCLDRRQRLFRNWLDANSAIGQRRPRASRGRACRGRPASSRSRPRSPVTAGTDPRGSEQVHSFIHRRSGSLTIGDGGEPEDHISRPGVASLRRMEVDERFVGDAPRSQPFPSNPLRSPSTRGPPRC